MKLRRSPKFQPYRPLNQREDWRDWPGWYLVGLGILFLVAVALVGVGHSQHGVGCVLAFGYLSILGSVAGMVVLVKYQRHQVQDLDEGLTRYHRQRSRRRYIFRE